MAQKLLKAQKRKVAPVREQTEGAKKVVLVGTYAGDQLEAWLSEGLPHDYFAVSA